jgi:hypothetical protein
MIADPRYNLVHMTSRKNGPAARASLEMRIAESWSKIAFDRIQVRGAMPAGYCKLPRNVSQSPCHGVSGL